MTGYHILWLFFVYSFLGWVLETVVAAARQKRFVNRGLVNAPFCVIYGVAAVLITLLFGELRGFWLFAAGMILATLIEWTAGHLIERLYHERWWDYTGIRGNLDGYICLPASLFWGALSVLMMRWGNPLLLRLYSRIPAAPGKLVIWLLAALLAVDVTATLCILSGRSKRIEQWKDVDLWLSEISSGLGRLIYGWVDRRIRRAYPSAKRWEAAFGTEETADKSARFASGCSFHKLVWLFVIGSFLGDIVETIFCRLRAGVWMSRSSLVWGPFSIVWGGAMVAATMLFYRYRDRPDRFLFIASTCLGGAYEYACSVLTELVFGKVFWDYSAIPFNLGGRINLLYCFFWGIAAVVWMKGLYPVISAWIERIPVRIGTFLTWLLLVLSVCDMAVSGMALIRSSQRQQGMAAEYGWQRLMDERFDDERLAKIYPNALVVE